MPSLRTLSESPETLSPLSEGSETLLALSEFADASSTHIGFYPSLSAYSAPYSFPSLTSYPGATVVVGVVGERLTPFSEATETLTSLVEGAETLIPLAEI